MRDRILDRRRHDGLPPRRQRRGGSQGLDEGHHPGAWEAEIDPRLLLAVLIGESIGNRAEDERNGYLDRFLPDRIFGVDKNLRPSLGMGNLQMEAFVQTVENHHDAFQQIHPQGLWRMSIEDEQLSIRVTAFRLRDLLDMQPQQAGAGRNYSREQLAGIGYNVGPRHMRDIGAGTYSKIYHTHNPMGDTAANYLVGFNDWYAKSDAWICGNRVLVC